MTSADFDTGTSSILGRALTAEIRSRMGAKRISGKKLAELVGVSQNYLAKRLRDEAPLTLDDVASIAEVLDPTIGAQEFVQVAYDRQHEELWVDVISRSRLEEERAEVVEMHAIPRISRDDMPGMAASEHDEDPTVEAEGSLETS